MNRREFARVSALTLAAAHLRAGAQTTGGKTGFAVIGLGDIARQFMEQVAVSETCAVTAFVTGEPEKGRAWAAKYNVPNAKIYTYDTMGQMKGDAAVQAVYVATPNALHRRDVVASAAAGKHVLCEKPMAVSVDECQQMVDACKAANVKLMIAYRMQYEPMYLRAKEMIRAGQIGRVAAVEGAFGFNAKPGVWRLTQKLGGGGPIVDVGIYPLNAIRFLLGEEPAAYTAQVSTIDTTSGRFAEVEQSMVWTMKMPSGALAACSTSYGAGIPGLLRIHGEQGQIEFQKTYDNGGVHLIASGVGGLKVDESSPAEANQLRLEAEHLAICMQTGAVPRSPGEEGLRDHEAFVKIYRAAGIAHS